MKLTKILTEQHLHQTLAEQALMQVARQARVQIIHQEIIV